MDAAGPCDEAGRARARPLPNAQPKSGSIDDPAQLSSLALGLWWFEVF